MGIRSQRLGILTIVNRSTKISLHKLHDLWKWLITPSIPTHQPDHLRQAQLLASLLLVSVGFGLLYFIFSINIGYYGGTENRLLSAIGITLIALAYMMNRIGRLSIATSITVGMLSLMFILLTFFTDGIPVDLDFLNYLYLPLIIASIFISPTAILLLGGLYGSVIFLAAVIVFHYDPVTVIGGPVFFVVIASGMIYLLARQRNVLEAIRKQELDRSERLYRTLFENANDAIFLIGLDNLHIAANEKAADLLGYSTKELVGMRIEEVIASGEYSDAVRIKTTLLAGVRPSVYERIFRKKNGEQFPVEITASLVFKADGQPLLIQSIVRDITKRKQMEEELQNLALFPSEDPSPVMRVSGDGRLLYANTASQPLLRFCEQRQELILPPDLLKAATEVLAGGTPKSLEIECHPKVFSFVVAPIPEHGYVNLYGQDSTERKQKEIRIQNQVTRLQVIHHIEETITSSLDLNLTLNVLLSQVIEHFAVSAADILLYNPRSQMLEITSRLGFHTSALTFTQLPIGKSFAGQAALERRLVRIHDLSVTPGGLTQSGMLYQEGFRTYTAVPLIAKGQIKGVLEIFHRSVMEPDAEWEEFLLSLAAQAAIAIDNAQLYEDAQRSNAELGMAYDATLEGWAKALELRDKETEGHSQRVTKMTLRLGQAMGMKDEALIHLRRGALLHDIGKMGIPDAILLKPGPLTPDEWEVMRKHPQYAYEMISSIEYLRPALDIPYSHHEIWDGSGYPQGLAGTQIPLAARVFAIVDVWDALTSDRPYRPRWPDDKVREYISSLSGKQFDPDVASAFLSQLDTDS